MNQKSCSEFSLAPKTQKTKKKLSHEKNLSKKGWYKVKHTSRYYEQNIRERKILNKKSKV